MKKLSPDQKKLINKFSIYGVMLFAGFVISDLTIIVIREYLIPQQSPPKKESLPQTKNTVERSQFSIITQRNLFSSKGEIPNPLEIKVEEKVKEDIPIPSTLPLNLLGTLVHTDPNKSVAAIELKSKNMTASFMVGAMIDTLARIEKIERGIVYFRNNSNGSLEYIELNKPNNKISFDNKKTPSTSTKPGKKEIESVGNNTFRVKRSDLNKYLNDLNSLLMQARAVPNRDPVTAEINGYRLVDFQPDSIFGQLGIPTGTLIKSANGEPVTSPADAMGLLNKFKTGNKITLMTEINGTPQTLIYEIQ